MKFHLSILLFVFLFGCQQSYAQVITDGQDNNEIQDNKLKPFIAYELGEAVFNKFKSISGEIGVRFPNNRMLRLTHMNVKLSEEHLSSDFATAVDGDDVEGKLFGFEVFYDFPILIKGLYISPSSGYYSNDLNHTVLSEEINSTSVTVGLGISYRETNIFGLTGLYTMLSIPMRTHLSPSEESKLGETIVKSNHFDNNIWFFVGYEF